VEDGAIEDRSAAAGLRYLLDRQQIEDTLQQYAWSIDLGDLDALRAVLADDVIGLYGDRDPIVGADAVVAWIVDNITDQVWQHHLLSVSRVEIDGDQASALTYHTSHQAPSDDPLSVKIIVARYHDDLRRVGADRWVISRKRMEVLRRENRPAG
jgi:hypothetical protein